MTSAVTVLFAAWVVLACGGLFAYSYWSATRRAEHRLAAEAREVASDIRESALPRGPAGEATAGLVRLVQQESPGGPGRDLSLLVVDSKGQVVWRSAPSGPSWPVPRDGDWRVVTVPAGEDTVVVALDWGRTEEALREQAIALLCLALLAVAAAALGSWVLVGRTLSPIGLLSLHAREASAEHLEVRLQAPSNDAEITELVATLNGLLERLAETAAAKGRFYAAASHELRTPLQALSGHLEVALARPRTGPEYQAALHEALLQTRRLTRLAQDLLLLNQLDSTPPAEMRAPVDLAEVCARVVRQVQPIVQARGLRLAADAISPVTIVAPPTHVEILVRNLVENAVRYAVSAGEVRLASRELAEGAVLTVFDECPPAPEWDPASPFEAFSRADRSRNQETGGHGLGLAICGAIAKANRWALTLHHDGKGVLATVAFCTGRAPEQHRP